MNLSLAAFIFDLSVHDSRSWKFKTKWKRILMPIWILQFFCLKKITFHVRVLQKQSLEMFYKKKVFLKFSQYSQGNTCVFTGKHLCWTLFLDSLFKLETFQAFRPATLFLVCICWDGSAISSIHPKYQNGWSGLIHLQSV